MLVLEFGLVLGMSDLGLWVRRLRFGSQWNQGELELGLEKVWVWDGLGNFWKAEIFILSLI